MIENIAHRSDRVENSQDEAFLQRRQHEYDGLVATGLDPSKLGAHIVEVASLLTNAVSENPRAEGALRRVAHEAVHEAPSPEVWNTIASASLAGEVENMRDTEINVARIRATRESSNN